MQGNVVTAARWLGVSLVLSSLILVGGFHWALSSHFSQPIACRRPQRESVANAPPDRVRELLDESEKLRQVGDEFERFWFLDQPSHMTPFRTHGGLGP